MDQFPISLHSKPYTYDARVFSRNLPPALSAKNDRDLLRATAVTRGWNGYRNQESAQKVDPGEENYPATPTGTRTRDLSITSESGAPPLSYPRSLCNKEFVAKECQAGLNVMWSISLQYIKLCGVSDTEFAVRNTNWFSLARVAARTPST